MAKNSVKVNVYAVVQRAVEEGAALGWRRAHKHTDEPTEDGAVEAIAAAVMAALGEVLTWEDGRG